MQESPVVCYNRLEASDFRVLEIWHGQAPLFKWRHFTGEIIACAVRWYLRYALNYRDVEERMQERGVSVDHTTVFRWVQCYAPELDTLNL